MTEELLKKLESYIENNYIDPKSPEGKRIELLQRTNPFGRTGKFSGVIPKNHQIHKILEQLFSQSETTFSDRLRYYINLKGKTDPEVYNKAGITCQYFNHIKNKQTKTPGKAVVYSLGLALELSIDEMNDLLASNNMAFNFGNKTDFIVKTCFEQKIYSIDDVNELLVHFNQKTIGGVE